MSDTLLMVADSERDANMLYGTGFLAGDPFVYLNFGRRPHIVLNDLEIDRARRQAPHCRAMSSSAYHQKLRRTGVKIPGFAHVIREILRENKVNRAIVPDNFPLGLARDLKRLGIKLKPSANFFPKREFKSADEVRKISAALMMAEVGMAEGMQALRLSKIGRKRQLIYRGLPLTSERLRAVIDCAILQASEAVNKLYDTVFHGQKIGLQKVRAGTSTAEIHECILQFFTQRGYHTGKRNGRMEGFFHGTGHGLGLDIHEAPRIGASSRGKLKAGQVVTVEPGLYYPEIGGVRLEDVALVTTNGAKNLTRFEKVLEI